MFVVYEEITSKETEFNLYSLKFQNLHIYHIFNEVN